MENLSKKSAKPSKYFGFVFGLCLIAIPITLYLVHLHFEPSATSVCNFGEGWDCDIVNKSEYSKFFGIPVSLIGLAGYIVIAALAFALWKNWNFQKIHQSLTHKNAAKLLTLVTGGGLLFTLYLTAVETFILETYCIFCVTQQVIILIIFMILIKALFSYPKETKV